MLVVDLYSPQSKVYNTSVLTIQLKQAESEKEENENILSSLEGWKYLQYGYLPQRPEVGQPA